MIYSRVQLRDLTTFQRLPSHKAFKEAEIVASNLNDCYLIEDDGPDHVKVSQGETAIRVPWSNILAATPIAIAPTPLQVAAIPEPPRVAPLTVPPEEGLFGTLGAEPVGLPPLPRKGPRKGQILR